MKLLKSTSGSVNLVCCKLVFGQMFCFLWNRILYLYLGYSYISIGKERDSYQSVPNYRPEIGDSIWNGLISIDPFFPLGDGWQDFARRIIAGAQHPTWQPYPHLSSSAPISSVTPTSGMIQWNLSITTTEWDTSLPSGAHLGDQAPEGRNCWQE